MSTSCRRTCSGSPDSTLSISSTTSSGSPGSVDPAFNAGPQPAVGAQSERCSSDPEQEGRKLPGRHRTQHPQPQHVHRRQGGGQSEGDQGPAHDHGDVEELAAQHGDGDGQWAEHEHPGVGGIFHEGIAEDQLWELRPHEVEAEHGADAADHEGDSAAVGGVGRPQVGPGHQDDDGDRAEPFGKDRHRRDPLERLEPVGGAGQGHRQVARVQQQRCEIQRGHDHAMALDDRGALGKDQGEVRDHRPPHQGPDEGRRDLRPERPRGQRQVHDVAADRPRREPERDDGGDREQDPRGRVAEAPYQDEARGDEQDRFDREDRSRLPRRGQPVIAEQGDLYVLLGSIPDHCVRATVANVSVIAASGLHPLGHRLTVGDPTTAIPWGSATEMSASRCRTVLLTSYDSHGGLALARCAGQLCRDRRATAPLVARGPVRVAQVASRRALLGASGSGTSFLRACRGRPMTSWCKHQ